MLIRKPTGYEILLDPLLSPAAALRMAPLPYCPVKCELRSAWSPAVQALAALRSGSVGLQSWTSDSCTSAVHQARQGVGICYQTGEMSQWAKCFPHQHENLSLIPSTHLKLGTASVPTTELERETETHGDHCLVCLARPSAPNSVKAVSKKRWRAIEKKHPGWAAVPHTFNPSTSEVEADGSL